MDPRLIGRLTETEKTCLKVLENRARSLMTACRGLSWDVISEYFLWVQIREYSKGYIQIVTDRIANNEMPEPEASKTLKWMLELDMEGFVNHMEKLEGHWRSPEPGAKQVISLYLGAYSIGDEIEGNGTKRLATDAEVARIRQLIAEREKTDAQG